MASEAFFSFLFNPPFMNPTDFTPITEDDIARYLDITPDFFERHAALLASVQLSSGLGNRAVSLQERQALMLREKIRGLEYRLVGMVRHGNENDSIAEKLQRWTCRLLQATQPREIPAAIVEGIGAVFQMPQAAIRVWGVSSAYASAPFAQGVSADAKTFADSLTTPYCGINSGFEAVNWLPQPTLALSVALLTLRAGPGLPVLGLLVLASPDPERFRSDMGTDFLEQLGELAGAALSRLRS